MSTMMIEGHVVLVGEDLEAARRVVESAILFRIATVVDGGSRSDLGDLIGIHDLGIVMGKLGRVGDPVWGETSPYGWSSGKLTAEQVETLAVAAAREEDSGADMARNCWSPGEDEYPPECGVIGAIRHQQERARDGARVLEALGVES